MKTIILTTTAVILSLCSCSNFLDEKVYSTVDEGDMYSNYQEADMATMGIYSVLTSGRGGWSSNWQSLCVYGTDEARNYFEGEKINDQYYSVSNYSHTTSDKPVEYLWSNIYSGIGKANDVYHKIAGMNLAEESKQTLQAEALFLRAYFYFNLVQLWGPVPLNTTMPDKGSVSSREAKRASVKEVYDQIVNDIEFAKKYLPVHQAEGRAGRITKFAAYGIASRIYLTMASGSKFGVAGYEYFDPEQCYTLAKTNADTVINHADNQFGLQPVYENIFKLTNKFNNEIMFEACFAVGVVGSVYAKMGGPKGNGDYNYGNYGYTGRGYLRPTVHLALNVYGVKPVISTTNGNVNSVTSEDVRFASNISTYDITNKGLIGPMKTTPENWYSYKFSLKQADMTGMTGSSTAMNQPILRYADVLLIYAEAAGMLDLNDPKAYEAINTVRQRARAEGTNPDYLKDLKAGDFANTDDFMDEIMDERMRELCFEGHRRPDLLRTSRLQSAISKMAEQDEKLSAKYNDPTGNLSQRALNADYKQTKYHINLKPYHILFPIPQYEMNISNNPEYQQNPGWTN